MRIKSLKLAETVTLSDEKDPIGQSEVIIQWVGNLSCRIYPLTPEETRIVEESRNSNLFHTEIGDRAYCAYFLELVTGTARVIYNDTAEKESYDRNTLPPDLGH